jgi:hypothetical protein
MKQQAEALNLETIEDIEAALDDLEESLPETASSDAGQGYDDGEYWDNRYGTWAVEPYDWLVEWSDVEPYINEFFTKQSAILCPGCGNAPFHPRMYEAGYIRQVCLDTSEVVVEQSIERFSETHPDMMFRVADCCDIPQEPDGSFKYILDKSLIDTLRCEAGSYDAPGSRRGDDHGFPQQLRSSRHLSVLRA